MSPRRQAYLGVGAIALVLVAIVAVGLVTRPSSSAAAQIEGLEDAVALGKLDREVVDELRTTGGSAAIVHLDTAAILAGLQRALGDARATELITGMSAAFAANKDLIRRALGPSADLVRDYEHLGAFVVRFEAEAPLLAALRSQFVREISADTAVDATVDAGLPVPAPPPAPGVSELQGAGAFVGVLDTGVDVVAHPQYFPAGSVVATLEAAPEDGVLDDLGHGTHVASTVLLMAPQAGLYVADVFHVQERRRGSGQFANLASQSNVLAGMDWLIGLRQGGVNLRAVNISLGGGHYPPKVCSDRYHLAEALAAGMIAVGAAGNAAFRDDENEPTTAYQAGIGSTGCDPNVLSVGAVTNGSCLDGAFDTIATFSQSSEALDILAPGDCIVAAGGAKSGTSMAAPHVSGAVAVLASAREASSAEIWTALVGAGPFITDPNSGITRHRLDIPAAVAVLAGSVGPLPTPEIVPTRGVTASTSVISPASALDRGGRFFDFFVIRNVGTTAATYRLVVSGTDLVPNGAEWISVDPASITLAPDDLGLVSMELTVPADAAPGDYEARITPVDEAASESEGAEGVLVRFVVGSASGAGGGGGSGPTGDDLAWLEDPIVIGVAGLIVLIVLIRLFQRPRRTS